MCNVSRQTCKQHDIFQRNPSRISRTLRGEDEKVPGRMSNLPIEINVRIISMKIHTSVYVFIKANMVVEGLRLLIWLNFKPNMNK